MGESEKNDNLVWPFRETVTMELLNQKEDSKHYLQTLQFSDDKDDPVNAGVTDQERSTEGFGLILYISLYFRASVSATNKPWLTITHPTLKTPPRRV